MNETHDGNLNKSKAPAPAKSEGTSGSKSCNETATLRSGSLPPASQVTTIDRDANKGKAILCAQKQNTADEKTWPHGRNVIPQSRDNSVLTHDLGGE
jgi:hypothetical protein